MFPQFTSARDAWMACGEMRRVRTRMKNFTYGRQWDDKTVGKDGVTMTEGDRMRKDGMYPLTNNLLRNLVKSVVGRFRALVSSERSFVSTLPPDMAARNNLNELDSRLLEEFLISGCAVQRVIYERRIGCQGAWVDNVSPSRVFFSRFTDPRGSDMELIGMLHEWTLPETIMRFGHGDAKRNRFITETYGADLSRSVPFTQASLFAPSDEAVFHLPADPSRCRVIEVWTRDITPGPDNPAVFDAKWVCRYFAPDGTLLDETASPFPSGMHPFAITLYPLTDGEVHPFIEDVVDNQLHINRTITILDKMMSASAKSLLVLPEGALPQGYTVQQAVDMWNVPGGVIPLSRHCEQMPFQLTTGNVNPAASQMLNLQMSMFRQISGVSGLLQGQDVSPSVSSSSIDTQVSNSLIALMDIFETFNSFRSRRDSLALAITR